MSEAKSKRRNFFSTKTRLPGVISRSDKESFGGEEKMAKNKFDITQHHLVPKHTKVSEKEKDLLLKKYNITAGELPKINIKDPAIAGLKAKAGDVIKINRQSPTVEETEYYRCVVDE